MEDSKKLTLTAENFDLISNHFLRLPISVKNFSQEAFYQAMQCDEAKTLKNIVYLWCAEKSIPRFNGKSNILYIGQTKNSFSNRYKNYERKWIFTQANSLKLSHALANYGEISFWICKASNFGENLLLSEGQLLWWYFQNHFEYPPFNYTKTNVRNNLIVYPFT